MSKKRNYQRKSSDSASHVPDLAEITTIDLEKLQKAPQSHCVMRLLSVLNDLDSGTSVNDLLQHKSNVPKNKLREKWRDGAILYLLRLRVGILYTALKDILKEMKVKVDALREQKVGSKTERLLWHCIIEHSNLDAQLTELVQFLEPGEADSLPYVRDQFSAHVDKTVFTNGLSGVLKDQTLGVAVRSHEPQRFRALFIDDIVAQYWAEQAEKGLPIAKDKEEKEMKWQKRYLKHISEVRSKTADFTYSLFETYCDEFDLRATPEQSKLAKDSFQRPRPLRRR